MDTLSGEATLSFGRWIHSKGNQLCHLVDVYTLRGSNSVIFRFASLLSGVSFLKGKTLFQWKRIFFFKSFSSRGFFCHPEKRTGNHKSRPAL